MAKSLASSLRFVIRLGHYIVDVVILPVPEAFKNIYNADAIARFANILQSNYSGFDRDSFLQHALANLNALEMKARSNQIVLALTQTLPSNFTEAANIIHACLASPMVDAGNWSYEQTEQVVDGIQGWMIMPLCEYVGRYGQAHFDNAMSLFHALTQRSTAEFGIRYFLKAMPEQTLAKLAEWTTDPSVHVRRLVSEGTRASLPWGMQLPAFLQQPAYTESLITALRDDPEEYVRRSVANHINDLSKVHPKWTANLTEKWLQDASPARKKLLKHACRTLLKQGNQQVLALFGFVPAEADLIELALACDVVDYGSGLEFEFAAQCTAAQSQQWMVDFVIHHQKANGTLTPKVFKWKSVTVAPKQQVQWQKSHAIKPITTRKYYNGAHRISVVINGKTVASHDFTLQGVN